MLFEFDDDGDDDRERFLLSKEALMDASLLLEGAVAVEEDVVPTKSSTSPRPSVVLIPPTVASDPSDPDPPP
jgi:hypothetical protein